MAVFFFEGVQEVVDEPRLAEAGLALDEERVSLPAPRPLPRLPHQFQLFVATVELGVAVDRDAGEFSLQLAQDRLVLRPPRRLLPLLQDGMELLRGLEPRRRILGQQHLDELGQKRRQVGVVLGRPLRRDRHVRLDDTHRVVAAERVCPRRQLVEHHTQGVEIRRRSDRPRVALLRRGVEQRPGELSLLRDRDRSLLELRDTEVHDPDPLVVGDEHVFGLEVTVDDARGMDRGEAGCRLERNLSEQRLRHRSEVLEQLPQRPPLHVLHHHEVDLLVVLQDRVDVDGADDVFVFDLLTDLRLAQEPLEEPGRRQQVGVHDLEGDALSRLESRGGLDDIGEVDRPHPSGAELGDDLVRPDLRPDHFRCSSHAAMISRCKGTFSIID
jgi:hypothetical protein